MKGDRLILLYIFILLHFCLFSFSHIIFPTQYKSITSVTSVTLLYFILILIIILLLNDDKKNKKIMITINTNVTDL